MRRWRLIVAAAVLGIPGLALGQTSAPEERPAVEAHPEISSDASWTGNVVKGIVILFAAAAICGPWAPVPVPQPVPAPHDDHDDAHGDDSHAPGSHAAADFHP